MNLCSKPSCARPGSIVLSYDYAERKALLDDPAQGELSPHVYVLCAKCAERLRPPKGWELLDRRVEPPLFLDRRERLVATVGSSEESAPSVSETTRSQLFFGYSA